MGEICKDRVVIITGSARGIGRAHALEFARQGAKVVVNDLGSKVDGTGSSEGLAAEVVEEIRALGGDGLANTEDVSDWEGAQRLINSTVEHYGKLDVVVNNAGILRDRMLVNMTLEEWDDVIRVHLRSTFVMTRWAANYWRDQTKANMDVDARVINTSSASGLYGNVGQSNYGAAKAGIASFTIIASQELSRYGVTVNAIAPVALTRMTEHLGLLNPSTMADKFDPFAPGNISPLVVWLGSKNSRGVTGRVFDIVGGHIDIAQGWQSGPSIDKDERWSVEELDHVVHDLVSGARNNADTFGNVTGH